MSTDVVTFQTEPAQRNERVISQSALYLFLEITLTLMVGTVLIWGGTNILLNWRQKRNWDKAEARRKAAAPAGTEEGGVGYLPRS